MKSEFVHMILEKIVVIECHKNQNYALNYSICNFSGVMNAEKMSL